MSKLILLATAFAVALFSAELQPTKYESAKGQIGKGQVVMLEVGSVRCKACQEMGELISQALSEKNSRKIFFIDVGDEREVAGTLKVKMIPTQIVYDGNGREIDRHIGGFTSDGFNKFMNKNKI